MFCRDLLHKSINWEANETCINLTGRDLLEQLGSAWDLTSDPTMNQDRHDRLLHITTDHGFQAQHGQGMYL